LSFFELQCPPKSINKSLRAGRPAFLQSKNRRVVAIDPYPYPFTCLDHRGRFVGVYYCRDAKLSTDDGGMA
jgi:hypothetical protein